MSTSTSLTNPYRASGLKPADSIRISIDVARDDHIAIRSVTLDWGTTNAVLTTFFKHLAEYVRANNLTLADKQQFTDYVNHLCGNATNGAGTITVPVRCPPNLSTGNGPDRDDRRPTDTMGAPNTPEAHKRPARRGKQTSA